MQGVRLRGPVEQAIAECKQTLQLDPHFLLAYRWAYSNREAAFSLTNVGTDLALLRSDLRFSAMMQKMNLAPESNTPRLYRTPFPGDDGYGVACFVGTVVIPYSSV